jgi:hypothetical protein
MVLGGVFTDKWIVQWLTDFISTGLDTPFTEACCRQMAHMMYALRRNIERLEKYYEVLDLHPDAQEYVHLSAFPSITMFLDKTGNITSFKYVGPLENDPGCVAFSCENDWKLTDGCCHQVCGALRRGSASTPG